MKREITIIYNSSVLAIILLFWLMSGNAFAQTNSLVFQGDGSTKAYMVMSNGNATTPIYLVVNNANEAAITRTGTEAGWIISENEYNVVRWNMTTSTGTFTVPFGASTGLEADEYIPLAFAKTSTGSADVMFSTYATGADNTPYPTDVTGMSGIFGGSAVDNLVDRFYFIDVTAAATASIDFSYRGSENGTTVNPTNLSSPQQWDIATSAWLPAIGPGANGVTGAIGIIPSGSTSSFSSSKVWALSHNENPLPIQLLKFEANCMGAKVAISWSTATEINNANFTVQRSTDASSFLDIASVPGAGNSNTLQTYFVSDNFPLNSTAYYRIKQTDFDGNSTYSEIVAVENCNGNTSTCNTYYNPSKGTISVDFPQDNLQPYTISMFDMLGQQVISETEKQTGHTELNVDMVAYGVYLVVVRSEQDVYTTKVYLSR